MYIRRKHIYIETKIKNMSSVSSHAHASSHSFGWKSYRLLRKKAMEQELSWTGLIISISIAFFIVATCATALRVIVTSLEEKKNSSAPKNERVLNSGYLAQSIFGIKSAQAATTVPYQAQVLKTTEYITLSPGEEKTLQINFKNTGKATWKPADVTVETGPYLKTFSKVKTSSWKKFYEPTTLPKNVAASETVSVSFSIKAPLDIEGTIQENFQLVSSQQPISGSLVRFFITIAKPTAIQSAPVVSPSSYIPASLLATTVPPVVAAPVVSVVTDNIISSPSLMSQPIIRVGLFSSEVPQRLTSDQNFDIYSANQILIPNLTAGTVVTMSYSKTSKQYTVATLTQTYSSSNHLRLVPKNNTGVVTLLDYRVGQKPQDNRFRNIVEYRYTEPAKTMWLINELPVEQYLKGLAETTNSSPVEFQKVMATIARSYAMHHYFRGIQYGLPNASTKHSANYFHIDSVYDQVYRGYNSELRLTGLTQAVEATAGVIVTYNTEPVITPYFSNSDGRTRDWTEVWGSTVMPWLRSVVVTQDLGKNLYGHGVGLSARGALLMVNEGQSWQNVLKYFYTGTDVKKIY